MHEEFNGANDMFLSTLAIFQFKIAAICFVIYSLHVMHCTHLSKDISNSQNS